MQGQAIDTVYLSLLFTGAMTYTRKNEYGSRTVKQETM